MPSTAAMAVYLDSVKLEPFRNGTAVPRQRVGTASCRSTPTAASRGVVQRGRGEESELPV